jgi:hypothetical protein
MQVLSNGKIMFDDFFEMSYYLFMEIGLSVNSNNYLYDQDTGIQIRYKDKYIKATVVPMDIYAGKNDIIFDPAHNYNLMTTLFGYFLDKESNNEEGDKIGFIAQFIDDNETKDKQRLSVQTQRGLYASEFYNNLYLAFIEMIFTLSGNYLVDLSNFDIIF